MNLMLRLTKRHGLKMLLPLLLLTTACDGNESSSSFQPESEKIDLSGVSLTRSSNSGTSGQGARLSFVDDSGTQYDLDIEDIGDYESLLALLNPEEGEDSDSTAKSLASASQSALLSLRLTFPNLLV